MYAKVETFNPGHSIKDRMAVRMIEDAEKKGLLKPGGTIIEGTSGNTGMGLAIAGDREGLPVHLHDHRQAVEGEGRCAAGVRGGGDRLPDRRGSRGSRGRTTRFRPGWWRRRRTPGRRTSTTTSATSQAHYETTGPEIWEQTDGRVDHLLVGVGTGGTICGAGRFLKEKNPRIKVWGIDTYGSVFKKYKETGIFDKHEIYPYVTEGIGEDFLPQNVDFSVIDHFEKVTDRDAAIYTREIVRQEGIWVGNSAGSADGRPAAAQGQFPAPARRWW